MLKVLIVEDEILTRIGLESMIRWEENGFTIVGIAKNGKEGLEFAIDCKPDIIITDVMMPKMNGIELMKALKNTDISPKFIVLSGYNEYTYVREALKLGAVDYILKLDIEPELLLNTLVKIKKSISIDPETDESSISWNEQTMVICKLLQGKILPSENIEQELASSKIELPSKNFLLVITRDPSDTEKIMQEVYYPDPSTILRTINELLTNFGVTYGCVVKNVYFLNILCPNKPLHFEDLQGLKNEITASLADYFYKIYNIGVTVSVSQLLHSYDSLHEEYLKSFETIFSDSPDAYKVKSTKISTSFVQLLKSVKENNLAGIDSDFSNLIDAIQKNGNFSQSEVFGMCNSLIQEINSQLTEQKKYLISWNMEEAKMTLKSCQERSDYVRLLSYCRKKVSMCSDAGDYPDSTLENAMKFIECNYKDPNLNLNEIASQVNVSPNHLCKVFSKKLNISPMQYVLKVRIAKAEKYLKTTDKQIKEIADLTGFNYSYYFSRTFKKITGLTPMEYRQG